MTAQVSRHAEDRLRERLGLNRKAAKRYASLAFEHGVKPEDYYFETIGKKWELAQDRREGVIYLFYKDCIHVFNVNNPEEPILVTMFDPTTKPCGKVYKAGKLEKSKDIIRVWKK